MYFSVILFGLRTQQLKEFLYGLLLVVEILVDDAHDELVGLADAHCYPDLNISRMPHQSII